jgi:hypothetical protein
MVADGFRWRVNHVAGCLEAGLETNREGNPHTQAAVTHFSETVTFPDVNPCTGVTGTTTDTFKGVTHVTELPDGSFHETTTVTDSFTFVPDDPSQPTYTGKSTLWDGETRPLNSQNNFTATFTTHSPSRAPTAPGSPATSWRISPCTRTAPSPSSSTRNG